MTPGIFTYWIYIMYVSRKLHDRGQFWSVKSLLSKNNGHAGEIKQHYHFSETSSGPTGVGVSRHFKEPANCFEVVEAVHNYMAVQWSLRPYDFSGHAILRYSVEKIVY